MSGKRFSNKSTAVILFHAGLAALALVLWLFLRAYGVPTGASPATGPMELVAPDGSALMAPALWFSGVSRDRDFQPGLYRFAFTIQVDDPDPAQEWLLFLPQAYGNAVRANVGGQDVGTIGDMAGGDSNIWNPGKVFRIKPGLVSARTQVVIEIHGRYEAGFTVRPYLMPLAAGRGRASFFRVVTDLGVWGLCGAILAMGIVVFIIGLLSSPRVDFRFFFGLAAVIASLFLTDFMTLEYLPWGLLAYKKIVVAFRHLSAALFAFGFFRLMGRKKDWFIFAYMAAQAACIVLVSLSRSMTDLKALYNYSYLAIFPILVYLMIVLIPRRRRNPAAGAVLPKKYGLLLFGTCAGMGTGLYDTVIQIATPGGVCVSHYGFFVLFLATSAYVVIDILGNFKQLVVEKMRSERYQQEALRDPLTEAFNRKVLPLILEETRVKTAAIMFDLDDFKGVNDNYGHPIGDLALKDVVTTVRRSIRQSDYLVRLGGDEFVVFLPGCPERKLEAIVKKILADVSESRVPNVGSEKAVSYRVSIGTSMSGDEGVASFDDLQALIGKADSALYVSKTTGKAKATFG